MIHMYTKTSQQVNRTMVDNEARYEVIASGVGPSKERGHSVAPSSRPTNHRRELIMHDNSSSTTDIEVGQLFFSKKDLKMRIYTFPSTIILNIR